MKNNTIEVKSIANIRDLGGSRLKEGRTVKYGKPVRSACLHNVTNEDACIFRKE